MKTMTCKQLGGPCDASIKGDTGAEMIARQDSHLREAVAAGRTDHEHALCDQAGRWKNTMPGTGWNRQIKRDFKALPAS